MEKAYLVTLVLCSVLPGALLVILATILLNKQGQRQRQQDHMRLSTENRKLTVPMRLAAYERLTLLLERISPESLVVRIPSHNASCAQFEAQLLASIREEWNHNLSQQVYVSETAWTFAQKARGQMVQLVRLCAEKVPQEAPAQEMVNILLLSLNELPQHPTQTALKVLREEAQSLF